MTRYAVIPSPPFTINQLELDNGHHAEDTMS